MGALKQARPAPKRARGSAAEEYFQYCAEGGGFEGYLAFPRRLEAAWRKILVSHAPNRAFQRYYVTATPVSGDDWELRVGARSGAAVPPSTPFLYSGDNAESAWALKQLAQLFVTLDGAR